MFKYTLHLRQTDDSGSTQTAVSCEGVLQQARGAEQHNITEAAPSSGSTQTAVSCEGVLQQAGGAEQHNITEAAPNELKHGEGG